MKSMVGCIDCFDSMCVGTTNVINFMDGINSITVDFSMVVIIPLALINLRTPFIDANFLYVVITSLLVFAFFNFRGRGKAKYFTGDVGAIGTAFSFGTPYYADWGCYLVDSSVGI